MRVRLHERSGQLGIYDTDFPQSMDDPISNAGHVFFHSGLDYLERFFNLRTSITLPLRPSSIPWGGPNYPVSNYYDGTQEYSLPDHGLGSIPFGMIIKDNYALSPGMPVQTDGVSNRYLTLQLTETGMTLKEHYSLYFSVVPAITVDIEIHLFRPITGNASNYLVREDPSNDYFEYDRGRITPDKHFLKKDSISPDFYIVHGKTLDLKNGGMRHVTPGPTGLPIDTDGYNGSFTIQEDYGVKVNG